MQMHRLLQENWRAVWSQPSGDRAGYGSDSCSDSGNFINNKRICDTAGQQLRP